MARSAHHREHVVVQVLVPNQHRCDTKRAHFQLQLRNVVIDKAVASTTLHRYRDVTLEEPKVLDVDLKLIYCVARQELCDCPRDKDGRS
jgi:hypothetical protein